MQKTSNGYNLLYKLCTIFLKIGYHDMIEEFDGVMICCPKCDWKPSNEIFLKLSIDSYERKSNKKIPIKCSQYYCHHSGTIEDWLFIYKEF